MFEVVYSYLGCESTVIDFAEAFLMAHICKCADWPQAIHTDCSCHLLVLQHALDARNTAGVGPLWCGPLWCGPLCCHDPAVCSPTSFVSFLYSCFVQLACTIVNFFPAAFCPCTLSTHRPSTGVPMLSSLFTVLYSPESYVFL